MTERVLMIARRITEARSLRQMEQKELARRLGIKQARLSNWEVGLNRPSADNIFEMADVLNVSADYLLGRTNDPNGQSADDKDDILEALQKDPHLRMVAKIQGDLTEEGKKDLLKYAQLLKNQRDRCGED